MMGTGEAEGDNRAIEAAEKAINNPLLDGVSMKGAKGVIISITGGEDMRLMEVDEAASHIKELVDPDANIIWGSAFNNALDGKIRVSVVATGIEAEAATSAEPARVFAFPTARKSDEIIRTPEPVIAPAPVLEPEPVAIAPDYEAEPLAVAEVIEEVAVEEAPLTLDPPEPVSSLAFDDVNEDEDELVLDTQSMLDDPVASNPVPPVEAEIVEEAIAPRRRWLVSGDAEEAAPAAKAPASGATLFERMSNIARSAARGDADTAEASDPLDIPRFLNRQNNQ
jgi:cell division protein FtsZ